MIVALILIVSILMIYVFCSIIISGYENESDKELQNYCEQREEILKDGK